MTAPSVQSGDVLAALERAMSLTLGLTQATARGDHVEIVVAQHHGISEARVSITSARGDITTTRATADSGRVPHAIVEALAAHGYPLSKTPTHPEENRT